MPEEGCWIVTGSELTSYGWLRRLRGFAGFSFPIERGRCQSVFALNRVFRSVLVRRWARDHNFTASGERAGRAALYGACCIALSLLT